MMCHLALLEGTDDGDGNTWLEPVTDDRVAAQDEGDRFIQDLLDPLSGNLRRC